MKPKIIVQGQRSRRKSLPIVLAATAVAIGAPVLYGLARNAALNDWLRPTSAQVAAESVREPVAQQLRQAQTQNEQLKQEIADLTRGREIDRQAWSEVQKSLATEQQESANLREQLAFYRGVVSPQALRSGLHVNELRIAAGPSPQTYRYDLVLVQSARQERRATGRVELRFIGRDGTAKRSVALSELALDGARELLFSFRHFQEFGGEFRLPRGFSPQRAVVTLMPDSGDSPHVEEEFEWSRVQEKPG